MDLNTLLDFAYKNEASDLHITTDHAPKLRLKGDIIPVKYAPLTADQIMSMLKSIMTEEELATYESELEIDFAIQTDTARFRVNAFNTILGPAAVFRLIPAEVLSLDQLNAPDIFKRLACLHNGLILVTGPTGSGKSTTLAAIINYINQTFTKHIITVEDPVEFVHTSSKSLINQREVGRSTKSFANALKSALREDPDVILVGELRDIETIQLALTAAETGHLVLGTLHTTSAASTIDRIIDVFPGEEKGMVRTMLSESLQAVIAQVLVKKTDNTGRIAIHEILTATRSIRGLIREGKIPQIASMLQVGSKYGMITMKDSLMRTVQEGVISQESANSIISVIEGSKSDIEKVEKDLKNNSGPKESNDF